ncbi:hypothetical protein K7X08_032155 [Anisodus acutangulus]|uniref:Uncharacterized protein n=1 Tax=Anisodus acutangulus TaxID=402998 RepID=A0A9Q1RJZ5_9SOLA|nr:hypothetical protein K7X08_032155 [Anisodus acutangulus]
MGRDSMATPLGKFRFLTITSSGILQPIPGNVPNPVPKWHDEAKHCAYHSGISGHDTENCYGLRDKIEALIKEGVIQLKGPASNENNNSLPDHDDANVNIMILNDHARGSTMWDAEQGDVLKKLDLCPGLVTPEN